MATTPPPSESSPTSAKRKIDYTRTAPRSASGERVADVLKTIVWVIPLTVLIWFYAEREQSTEIRNVTIPIAVRINAPNKIVTLQDPADGKLLVTLSGPQKAVADLIKLMNQPDHPQVLRPIDAATPRGPLQLPASAIADDPLFVQGGITVSQVTPQSLQLYVDDLETEELPISAVNDDNLEGGMRFSPSTVRVTAPRTVFEEAMRSQKSPDGKLYLTADISKLKGLMEIPGSHEAGVDVSLGLNNPNLKIEPPRVTANFVVVPKTNDYTVKNVPIWETGPTVFLQNNAVEIQGSNTLVAVTMTGPVKAIQDFKDKYEKGKPDTPFVALLYVDGRDRGEVLNKPLTFLLPEGLRIKSVPGQNLTADFRVTPR